MALDTLCISCLTEELKSNLINGRIDKIHQPERDEIILGIRTFSKNYKLVLSASPSHARIHFSEAVKQNPLTPPMFCMLLRKHLSSGKIADIYLKDFERIISFEIETYNELGDLCIKHLVVELMGKNSNIILLDSDMRIIDSARHVDFTQSTVRQILPGCTYTPPPSQEKVPVLNCKNEDFTLDFSKEGLALEKVILQSISGLSPLSAREIVHRAIGSNSLLAGELSSSQKQSIINELKKVAATPFYPCLLIDKTGNAVDFSAIKIEQYSDSIICVPYDSVSSMLEDFYKNRDIAERIRQKSSDLAKILKNHEERLVKKSIIQKKTLDDAKKKEDYKIKGDLLTANIYRINQGDEFVILENYYDPVCPPIKIQLQTELSPSKNAQRYYKLYTKLKNAEIEAESQLKKTFADLEYIKSSIYLLGEAKNEEDLNLLRKELSQQGFLKKNTPSRKQKEKKESPPLHFVSKDGFDIYVGKNNTQNDYLTLKFANRSDLWFHTKNIHGSHTIIKLGQNKEVPPSTILEAAGIAAYYSQGKNGSNVPVDYTEIRNVKKPNGAKPGMVIYDSYNTVFVNPICPEK